MKLQPIKKIGILDGMGAFAGSRFFQLTLEKIAQNHLVFPEIILNAVSIDDFISDPNKLLPAQKILSSRVRAFNHQHVTMIVMACNTAHLIHPHLQKLTRADFPSIIDLVVRQAISHKCQRIGILASPMTLQTHLYENALIEAGLNPVVPDESFRDFLEAIIRHVIDNSLSEAEIGLFEKKSRNFVFKNKLDSLILGCTELPLAFPKSRFTDITILDSLDILADSVVDYLKC